MNSRNKGCVVEATKLKSIRCSNLRRCSTNRAETNGKIKVLNVRTPLHHSAQSYLLPMTVNEMATGHLGLKVCSISSGIGSKTAKFNSKVVCLEKKTDREPIEPKDQKLFSELKWGKRSGISNATAPVCWWLFFSLCQSPADVPTNQPTSQLPGFFQDAAADDPPPCDEIPAVALILNHIFSVLLPSSKDEEVSSVEWEQNI